MDIEVGWKGWLRKGTLDELFWRVIKFQLQYHPGIFLLAEKLLVTEAGMW